MRIIIIILFIGQSAFSQTYYIASNKYCNVNNSGLDSTLPTCVSKFSNDLNFGQGADFLSKRGDTIVGRVVGGGNSLYSGPINDSTRYAAYGVGAKPILTTESILEGTNVASNWTKINDSIWFSPLPFLLAWHPRIWVSAKGQNKFVEVASGEPLYSNSANHTLMSTKVDRLHPFTYHNALWDGQQTPPFYFYSPGGNPANLFDIQYSGADQTTLTISAQKNIVIEDLDIRGSSVATLDLQFSQSITVRNCEVGMNAMRRGIRTEGSQYLHIHNNKIVSGDTIITTFNTGSIGLSDGVGFERKPQHIYFHHNEVGNWGHVNVTVNNYETGPTDSIENVVISDNYIYSSDVDYNRAISTESNESKLGSIIFERNFIKNHPINSQLDARGTIVRNNIFWNETYVQRPSYLGFDTGNGISLGSSALHEPQFITITNNVFYNIASAAIYSSPSFGGKVKKHNIISGNIMLDNGNRNKPEDWQYSYTWRNGVAIAIMPGVGNENNTWSNNNVYNSINPAGDIIMYGTSLPTNYTDQEYTANQEVIFMGVDEFNGYDYHVVTSTGEVNRIYGNTSVDPMFVNPAGGDFQLQPGSPLVGTGIGLMEYPEGVPIQQQPIINITPTRFIIKRKFKTQ